MKVQKVQKWYFWHFFDFWTRGFGLENHWNILTLVSSYLATCVKLLNTQFVDDPTIEIVFFKMKMR